MHLERTANRSAQTGASLNWIFMALFALSGATALMYEVVWVRQFTLVLGASSYAVTITLAAFMSGLGLGAWILGRVSDSLNEKQLIQTYIGLELAIGAYSLILPLLLGWAQSGYVTFHQTHQPELLVSNGLRLCLAFLLLLVPSTFIGATLPVLSRYLIRMKSHIPLTISKLYALNTLGALAGTVLTGYTFLPLLGVRSTTLIAVAINFFVAGAFWLVNVVICSFEKGPRETVVRSSRPDIPATPIQKALLFGFCISGAAAMFYEVAWTRTLSMVLGTTTFAFTTMLATFLVGIALGSAVYSFVQRFVSGVRLFIGLQFLAAFSVLLSIPLFEQLPMIFLSMHGWWADTWFDIQVIRFFLAASVMLIPTLALGTLLPAVSAIFIKETDHLGKRLGTAYGLNTLGNVIGAVVAGLCLVPLVGMQKTIMIGAIMNLGVGIGMYMLRFELGVLRRTATTACAGLMAGLIIWLISPWAPRIMNSGPYLYAPRYHNMVSRYQEAAKKNESIPVMNSWDVLEMAMKQYALLYYNSGITATVAVMERKDGVRFLTIDGKTDASTGEKSDMRTQVLIGQVPMLFHDNPDKVLIVGLGSGVTAGSVLTHEVRIVDCAEISTSVIEAADFFSEANHDALDDRRLRIIPRDARNYLLTSRENYDVIISQPSNPWISGESALFSMEWYQTVHDHLSNGGLFLQWVPSYLMSSHDLKIIMHTLRSVFPNLTLWSSGSVGDLILLARKGGELEIDYGKLKEKLQKEAVFNDVVRVHPDPFLAPFELFVMNEKELSTYLYSNLRGPLERNTDDLLFTEFSTPKNLIRRKNVVRFSQAKHLHGDPEVLMEIIKNFDVDEIRALMKQKIREGV